MMNRIVYSALAIFCFAIVSCTNEVPTPEYGEDYIVLNVFNSPMTMAEGNPDTEYERKLNRLDIFFYVKDKTHEPCVYYHKADVNEMGSAQVSLYVNDNVLNEIFPSGSLCDVLVVANLPEEYTFEAKTNATIMQNLGESVVLNMEEREYDVIDKPFVMAGTSRVQKGTNSSMSAKIALNRVASKVTMTVKVPKTIEVEESNDKKVKMLPILEDDKGNVTLKTSFHYGMKKSYLSKAYTDDQENFIDTGKISYTLSGTTDTHYVFTCNMPFYTYARSWAKGSETAAYVKFEMPWGVWNEENNQVVSVKTYYYQILVNGQERNFKPNTHYDMIVSVGVLGSTVEALPEVLNELSYYVLDWTKESGETGLGDRHEDVVLEKFNYLEVPQTYIEMDNVNTVAIRYNASHKIGVKFNTEPPKSVEGLDDTDGNYAFYINNGSGAPEVAPLPNISIKDNFTDDNKGCLTFNYKLSNEVYSPAYVFITIWLDVDEDGVHDVDDEILTEDVTIVIYPAIYILGDNSTLFSVFVNGWWNNQGAGNLSNFNDDPYREINGEQVGKVTGWDTSTYMHVISVSSFSDDNNTFDLKVGNSQKTYQYIIGDPRRREPTNLNVPKDGEGWVKDGSGNYLTSYYPTSDEKLSDWTAGAFQIIAPKFRISSKLAGYSHCSPKGAEYRCASYQEDGYPAGRWRLPTTAEVLFVINLQQQGKIQDLFVGGSNYCSATHTINTTKNDNNTYTLTVWEGIVLANNKSTVSVRCVYDEWYWGSEKEANPNSSYNGGYEFTWGDRFIY